MKGNTGLKSIYYYEFLTVANSQVIIYVYKTKVESSLGNGHSLHTTYHITQYITLFNINFVRGVVCPFSRFIVNRNKIFSICI